MSGWEMDVCVFLAFVGGVVVGALVEGTHWRSKAGPACEAITSGGERFFVVSERDDKRIRR